MQGRACGVLVHGGRILLQRKHHDVVFALPGGKIEAGETPEVALVREFAEELGWVPVIGRRLWVLENAFTHHGQSLQQIETYIEVTASALPEEIIPRDETLAFRWASPAQLAELDFRPSAILPKLSEFLLLR